MGEEPLTQAVAEFFVRWNLNGDAQAKVLSISDEVRQFVIANFAPRDALDEVSGKLISFAGGLEKQYRQNGTLERFTDTSSYPAFINQWGLNEDAQAKLHKLKPEQAQAAMAGFSPPPHFTEFSGKFIMYAAHLVKHWQELGKGKGGKLGQGGGAPGQMNYIQTSGTMSGAEEVAGMSEEDIQTFAAVFMLGDNAIDKLRRLPPAVQEAVFRDFAPPENMADCNGKFIMFAAMLERNHYGKSHVKGKGVPGAFGQKGKGVPGAFGQKGNVTGGDTDVLIQAFCQYWSLNEDALGKLYKLQPETQQLVMAQFDPKQTGQDLSGKFIMFAAGIEKGRGEQGGGKQGKGKFAPDFAHTICGGAQGKGSFAAQAVGQAVANESTIQSFCDQWSLNEDAMAKIHKLTPDVQAVVMAQFDPPWTGQDVSGKFIMFAASVSKSQGKGQASSSTMSALEQARERWKSQQAAQGMAQAQAQAEACQWPGQAPSLGAQGNDQQAFAALWGLNADAQKKLFNLNQVAQQKVMSSFDPPWSGQDVSGKFIMFAASVEKGPNKGDGRGIKRPMGWS